MLDVAVNFLARELNTYLLARTGGTFGSALLSRVVDDGGKWAIPDDQIGVALVNIDEERAVKSQLPQTVYANGRQVVLEPEIKLNLYLMFAGCVSFRKCSCSSRRARCSRPSATRGSTLASKSSAST